MTLSEMRRALETAVEEPDSQSTEETMRPKSRLPPERRGVAQSRSCLVEMDLPAGASTRRKGTLTFANSVSELKRSGSSRPTNLQMGENSPAKPLRRAPPRRAQSCMDG